MYINLDGNKVKKKKIERLAFL